MKIRLPSVLACGLLALTACSSAPETSIGVSQILLGGEVNIRDEIEQPRSVFSPEQAMLHAHAFVTGLTQSTLVRAEWWFDGDDPARKIYETSVTVTPERPVAKFTIQSTRNWPEGDYRFVLFADDTQISEEDFSVEEAQ